MSVEVVYTDEFGDWFAALTETEKEIVVRLGDMLEDRGLALGFPYSSAIEDSKYALRELRSQSKAHPLRVFYAFDPAREAVLLIGGDKTGDKRFYERMIPVAEKLWEVHLQETKR